MSVLRLTNRLATRAPCAGLSRALAIEGAMGRLILTAILLAIVTPAAAQTADRLYLMDCGHNSAKDQARWSPGVNVGKPIELSDTCVLIKHREQWLLWDTVYPDAVADQPVDRSSPQRAARSGLGPTRVASACRSKPPDRDNTGNFVGFGHASSDRRSK